MDAKVHPWKPSTQDGSRARPSRLRRRSWTGGVSSRRPSTSTPVKTRNGQPPPAPPQNSNNSQGASSLDERRNRQDLIEVFKMSEGMTRIRLHELFTLEETNKGTRGRRGATGKTFGLAISRSRVQILLEATLRNNLRQVVYTYVPLSPSSITWYRRKGGDALRLGR